MRRIIERIVTIVTTTTWKISWEAGPLQSSPAANTVSLESPSPEIMQSTAPHPTTVAAKEVDETETNDIHEPNGR
jgi:hypothetical protein